MNILIYGEKKYQDFYKAYFESQKILVTLPEELNDSQSNIDIILLFSKKSIILIEDKIREIREKFEFQPLMLVSPKRRFYELETLFSLGVNEILYDNKPEIMLNEIKTFLDNLDKLTKDKKNYIIDFFENKGTFFIDISGTLEKEKLEALRLMFKHFLYGKKSDLKGIVYIFNNTDERAVHFATIWSLFWFWDHIGIDFNKVSFLTSSKVISENIFKHLKTYGIKQFPNLLEVSRSLYPELKDANELDLFEFSSSLLEKKIKVPTSK